MTDKQDIIQAAKTQFHHRGYQQSELDDIAADCGVEVVDIQAQFAEKNDLCRAVIADYIKEMKSNFREINEFGNARQRLSAYLDQLAEQADDLVKWGCPLTGLYVELSKCYDNLSDEAAELVNVRLEWITEQFVFMSKVDLADDLAHRLTGALHGVILIAQANKDPQVLKNQLTQLKLWIRSM